jgi:replicative DNA helicase
MKNKLTLRLDDSLIKRAKKRAKQKGTSVSQMVADYFTLIETEKSSSSQELPPITASLAGILKDADIREKDYKAYLKNKHLT